jgi:ABC-type amino acid transport substrate-binding protein
MSTLTPRSPAVATWSRRGRTIACLGIVALLGTAPARAAKVMDYVYHPPESALDVRYLYHWEILRTALEKTRPKWGPYRMTPSASMTERRQAFELKNATGKLTIMYLSTTPDFERTLIPIRIPVDRNLGGYSVFLIRQGEQPRFAAVRTVEDLRRFTFGLGLGWVDVEILRANGLNVVTGSSYEGLFEMLAQKRFDVFLRAAVEVLDEVDRRKASLPGLGIEQSLIVYYPLPMYFWFSRTAEGRRLAARAEEGMRMMIADGTYDAIFDKYQRRKIERLRLKERRIIRIDNPFVGPATPFADKRLWFDPQTYR